MEQLSISLQVASVEPQQVSVLVTAFVRLDFYGVWCEVLLPFALCLSRLNRPHAEAYLQARVVAHKAKYNAHNQRAEQ